MGKFQAYIVFIRKQLLTKNTLYGLSVHKQ